ncbi:MAG: flagellar motor switch protein FliM [Bacilli bacterium]
MPDILSQGEIDALLTALSSGEVSAEDIRREDGASRIRPYDFKRAMRFSKEHLRTISRIHELYSRLLATYLSVQARTVVQVLIASVDQVPYEEFVRSIPEVTVLHVIDVKTLGGKFLVEMGNNVASAMLDRLLGGLGHKIDVEHRFTDIDILVMERLFARSLPSLSAAWAGIADLQFTYDGLEINPQFIQIANQNDVVLVVSLAVSIGPVSGLINLCMPHVVLETVMPRLSNRFAFATPQRDGVDASVQSRLLSVHMGSVEVGLKAEIGHTSIRVDEFLGLKAGDVIALDQPIDRPLTIRVGEEPKYWGYPGTTRGRYALKISRVVEEGVEVE